MNEKIKNIVTRVGTDISGKWIAVNKLDSIVNCIVSELQLNGYDDAAKCLTEEYITIED